MQVEARVVPERQEKSFLSKVPAQQFQQQQQKQQQQQQQQVRQQQQQPPPQPGKN